MKLRRRAGWPPASAIRQAGAAPTYPVLWSHDADRERAMAFDGDSDAQPRTGGTSEERTRIREKVASIVDTASHCHFSQNCQFNSQSTAMQFTTRRTIGGRAWISVRLRTEALEKALVAWGNTSLGLLLHWYHANKQQAGRGNIGRTALEHLPVLDVTALTPHRLTAAVAIFDDLKRAELRPIHELASDRVRMELDARFCVEVLGLPKNAVRAGGAVELLRMKLANEPSIRGRKQEGVAGAA